MTFAVFSGTYNCRRARMRAGRSRFISGAPSGGNLFPSLLIYIVYIHHSLLNVQMVCSEPGSWVRRSVIILLSILREFHLGRFHALNKQLFYIQNERDYTGLLGWSEKIFDIIRFLMV